MIGPYSDILNSTTAASRSFMGKTHLPKSHAYGSRWSLAKPYNVSFSTSAAARCTSQSLLCALQVQKDQPSPPTSGSGGGGGCGGGGSYPPHTVLEMPALSPTMSQGETRLSRMTLFA